MTIMVGRRSLQSMTDQREARLARRRALRAMAERCGWVAGRAEVVLAQAPRPTDDSKAKTPPLALVQQPRR